MKLINDIGEQWIARTEDIALAIGALDPHANTFTVLSRGEEEYIQTAFEDGRLVVERRDGSADRHFRAWHMNGNDGFAKPDVQRLFLAYFEGSPSPPSIDWRPMTFSLSGANWLRGFSLIKALILIALVVALYFLTSLIREALR